MMLATMDAGTAALGAVGLVGMVLGLIWAICAFFAVIAVLRIWHWSWATHRVVEEIRDHLREAAAHPKGPTPEV